MEWTHISTLPKDKGFYQCYFKADENWNEGIYEYWFNGTDFVDGNSWRFFNARCYGKKITNEVSHWVKLTYPN